MLLASTPSTLGAGLGAETKAGLITLDTGSLVVEIKGGVEIPQFFFWESGNDTDVYKLQLDQVFEVLDNNSNGIYDLHEDQRLGDTTVPLATLSWEFSDFLTVNDTDNNISELHFNITSVSPAAALAGAPPENEMYIQFRIHMDVTKATELKFDVVIDNYNFTDPDALLVVAFKLMTPNNETIQQDGYELQFGEAFFQSASSANDTNGEMQVGLTNDIEDESRKIYLAYEHFDGLMVHDPVIGLSSVDDTVDDTTDDTAVIGIDDTVDEATDEDSELTASASFIETELSTGDLVAPSILATLAFVLLPALIYSKKRK